MVQPASGAQTTGLRSANGYMFVPSPLRTKLAEKAFLYSAPAARNSLLADIRSKMNFTTFKHLLKIHLFIAAFIAV
jgi:hypothetical protein